MRPRAFVMLFSALACTGCGSSSLTPAPVSGAANPAVADSAVRLPAAQIASAAKRRAQGLIATSDPLTALAWPLTALAWPLTALAWPGQTFAPSYASCGYLPNGKPKNANNGADCKSIVNGTAPLVPFAGATPNEIPGVQPGLLQYIYDLPATGGAGQTVGVVVANDDPNAESDLAVYRNAFGLTPCTTANGCFRKVAGGGGALPTADAGWSIETSLDLDAISAACARCRIVLVEAASDQIPDLATAVDTAVAAGATVVNNSYGVPEASDNVQFASHYDHPGVPMTAAAGDVGSGVQFPASSPYVTAVGGTTIVRYGSSGIAELVWPQTGAGCSAFFAKPAWQHDAGCSNRTVNDVAMLADPIDGIAVYDSTLPGTAAGGWTVIGGTSLGSVLVASLYALAANGTQMGSNAGIYAAASAATWPQAAGATASANTAPKLLDITSGSDGMCTTAYLCTGEIGYDAPSGNGVPWGVGAFAPTP